jgi:hypothetical protein
MPARPGVIAFAKDWHEDPTSNHHVLIELARSRPVLWLNSVATRTPKLTSGRDLGKIKRKLGEFARRARCRSWTTCGCSRRWSCRCRTTRTRSA